MATTTTNYGFDIPQSTDLVKDGATAIATLGQDIDTAMNTALGTKKAGMVLLNTTSFSGVASQSISDVFSTTYDNYAIILSYTDSGVGFATMRLRVSGADVSTNTYRYSRIGLPSTSTTSFGESANGVSAWQISYSNGATTTANLQKMDILNPFLTKPTGFVASQTRYDTTPIQVFNTMAGTNDNATSYTGFTLIGFANITGTVSVYGYNK
jgi:hypothetical protein